MKMTINIPGFNYIYVIIIPYKCLVDCCTVDIPADKYKCCYDIVTLK